MLYFLSISALGLALLLALLQFLQILEPFLLISIRLRGFLNLILSFYQSFHKQKLSFNFLSFPFLIFIIDPPGDIQRTLRPRYASVVQPKLFISPRNLSSDILIFESFFLVVSHPFKIAVHFWQENCVESLAFGFVESLDHNFVW